MSNPPVIVETKLLCGKRFRNTEFSNRDGHTCVCMRLKHGAYAPVGFCSCACGRTHDPYETNRF